VIATKIFTGPDGKAPNMTTQELTQAASQIAGGILAAVYGKSGAPSEEALANIARVSVQIARKIEEEARSRPRAEAAQNWVPSLGPQ
jgi:hypothetical protein